MLRCLRGKKSWKHDLKVADMRKIESKRLNLLESKSYITYHHAEDMNSRFHEFNLQTILSLDIFEALY